MEQKLPLQCVDLVKYLASSAYTTTPSYTSPVIFQEANSTVFCSVMTGGSAFIQMIVIYEDSPSCKKKSLNNF